MRTKSQHYVPRFYLKEFAKKKGSRHIIQCFNKSDGKTFSVNIKNICQENGFYDIKINDDFYISIEESLARFEGNVAPVYKKLIKEKKLSALSLEERVVIATFVALQMLRTPEERLMFEHMKRQLIAKHPSLEKQFETDIKDENKLMQISFIKDNVTEFTSILMNLKWVLVLAPDNSFWTSDNPVYKHNEIKTKFYSNLGLVCKGIQVIFPLTHNLLLIILDGDAYKEIKADENTANAENIKFYNFGQTVHSIRHIFGEKPNFLLAEQILKDYPEYKDPDRIRMVIS